MNINGFGYYMSGLVMNVFFILWFLAALYKYCDSSRNKFISFRHVREVLRSWGVCVFLTVLLLFAVAVATALDKKMNGVILGIVHIGLGLVFFLKTVRKLEQ